MAIDEFDDLANPYRAPVARLDERPSLGAVPVTRGIDLARENPWLTIWTRPRATIRGIVDRDPGYRLVPLACGSGIVHVFEQMIQKNAGDVISLPGLLGIAAVIGPLAGLMQVYVGGWWFGNMGRIFKGHADSDRVRTVCAWSAVPTLATIPFLALAIAMLGRSMFTADMQEDVSIAQGFALIGIVVAQVILGIWSAVIFVKGLAEVHGFSAWRSLACIVFPVFAILLILVGFFLTIKMAAG